MAMRTSPAAAPDPSSQEVQVPPPVTAVGPAPSTAAEAAPANEPNWVRELWDRFFGNSEVQLYLAAMRGMTISPGPFAKRWATGERFAQNPLLFMATSAALLATIQSRVQDLVAPHAPRPSLTEHVFTALMPYVYYSVLAVTAHAVLRLCGSRRRVLSTVAMALYAGGAWATLSMIAAFVLLGCRYLILGRPVVEGVEQVFQQTGSTRLVFLPLTVGYGLFCRSLGFALGALHRTRWWTVPVAFAAGLLVAGLVPEVPILHIVLRMRTVAGLRLPLPLLEF